jgi:diacylglycerol kinase (ATP)
LLRWRRTGGGAREPGPDKYDERAQSEERSGASQLRRRPGAGPADGPLAQEGPSHPEGHPAAGGNLARSFDHAFQGLVWVFRHQRNMRIHLGLSVLVLLAALFFNLSRVELLAVFSAIALVFMAELLNTAIETAIDLMTSEFDPRAKVAKDVAAAGALVAAVYAVLVGYFVFADKAASLSGNVLAAVRGTPVHLTFITLLLVVLLTIVVKARMGRQRLLHGGLPSGHAAVAFAAWTAVTFISAGHAHHILLSALTFLLAVLTAQSRVQAGVHTPLEVVLGALLGTVIATLLFQLV